MDFLGEKEKVLWGVRVRFVTGCCSWIKYKSNLSSVLVLILRKVKLPFVITRLTAHFTCGLISELVISKHIEKSGQTWH